MTEKQYKVACERIEELLKTVGNETPEICKELKKGEKSGISASFNHENFKQKLHQKYSAKL